MSALTELPEPVTREELITQLAASRADVESLRGELEETNRGVLALYAELDAQADELRQATELKSRFLAYMSHEFRTPIGSVLSIARLLMDRVDGPLTDEQEKQVRFIQETSMEFSEMVNDLLDLAKVEAGRIDISPDWFEMVDLFSTLRGMFKPVLTNPDLLLIFEEPQDVPKLYSDDRKLAQILRNFISNALKFTAKGEVRVSAKREEGGLVTFSVADTGIGIAAEFHHAMFKDFNQVDSPIQKRLRGTGLGLSLSKKLAELLGGSVGLVSEPGVGSTFSVTIPIGLPPPAALSHV
ncbi:MAG: ATP-binding protein [Polaromonas sp.]|nr:ATP-binding protein [Polaromonas sp.]